MELKRLYEILSEITETARPGEDAGNKKRSSLEKQKDLMLKAHGLKKVRGKFIQRPAKPDVFEVEEGVIRVDCHYHIIDVDKAKAEKYYDKIITAIRTHIPQEDFDPDLDYKVAGKKIGGTSPAFRLFAVGHVLGLWRIVTPKTLGITNPQEADQMADAGLIMVINPKITEIYNETG
ncbi:hypothetical protein MYX07_01340, partial [Patescibacteria group bacterium AH-259-L07]|nr:hypothetical protein [Patescibacteria group bacterium AH-259-L07]